MNNQLAIDQFKGKQIQAADSDFGNHAATTWLLPPPFFILQFLRV